jgi:hypothetical protein
MDQYEVRYTRSLQPTSFFFVLRAEDLRLLLTVMMGAAGVAILANNFESAACLTTSPLSLADAMNSSD